MKETLSSKRKELYDRMKSIATTEDEVLFLDTLYMDLNKQDKEFIKDLKEEIDEMYIRGLITHGCADYFKREIDKLAGEELANHSPQEKSFNQLEHLEDTSKDICANCGYIKSNHEEHNDGSWEFNACKKFTPKKKGLKVIDGTPTAISNYLSEREKKGCGKLTKKGIYDISKRTLEEAGFSPACSGEEK